MIEAILVFSLVFGGGVGLGYGLFHKDKTMIVVDIPQELLESDDVPRCYREEPTSPKCDKVQYPRFVLPAEEYKELLSRSKRRKVHLNSCIQTIKDYNGN